jgi:mono/diheme cytochrome c family protein
MRYGLPIALVLLVSAIPAAAQPALDGATIARDVCASCHVEAKASPAPSFSSIARMPSTTKVAIKVFLKTPHAPMPNIMLSEDEIDALADFILSHRTN